MGRSLHASWVLAGVPALIAALAPNASAEAPAVSSFYPPGVQIGQSAEVTINGKPGTPPVHAWTDSAGLALTISEDGKTITATADETATPGLHWIRIYNAEGANELRPFFVGVLPESNEAEPNDAHAELTATEIPVVVNGILEKAGDVDTYAIALEAGETLIASIEANRSLFSPMDGILQVLSPAGFVIEQNDDDHGVDPQIVFTAPESGLHFVRLFAFPADPNSTIRYAGGGEYIYRLALTTGPFIDHLAPGSSETNDTFAVTGWNLPSEQMRLDDALQIPGLHRVRRPDLDEPPALAESAMESYELPLRVIGHLGVPGEVDQYRFAATQDQSLRIALRSRALERPLDGLLRIYDADGKQLQETDDAGRNEFDPALTWKAPADGTYAIEVHDRFGHGGPRYVYDLSIEPEQPAVQLQVSADQFKVKPGESIEIDVTVARQGGFNTELQIVAENLPEGVTCGAVTSPGEGDASRSVKLKLEAAAEIVFSGLFRIVGTGPDEAEFIATAPLKLSGTRTDSLWLTVGP